MKEPIKFRGCEGKMKFKSVSTAILKAVKRSLIYQKQYGVYKCPHCGYFHLTTKLYKSDKYAPLIYRTDNIPVPRLSFVPQATHKKNNE